MYGRTNVTQKQHSWPHKTLCKTSAQICTQHQRIIAKGLYCHEIQHHKCCLSTFLQLPAKFRTQWRHRDAMRHTQIWGSCPPKGWSRTEQDGDVTGYDRMISNISIVWAPNVTKNNGPKVACRSFVQQHPLHPGHPKATFIGASMGQRLCKLHGEVLCSVVMSTSADSWTPRKASQDVAVPQWQWPP